MPRYIEIQALRSTQYDPALLKKSLYRSLDQSMEMGDNLLAYIVAKAIDRAINIGAFDDLPKL